MGHHPVEDSNRSNNPLITEIIKRRLSRRDVLKGGLSVTAMSFMGSMMLSGCSTGSGKAEPVPPRSLGFNAVSKSLADRVVLPRGYSARVLYALGDPIAADLPPYGNDGGDDGHWDRRSGDHHDAMSFYPLPKGSDTSDRGLLVINHEEITDVYLHENGPTTIAGKRPLAEVLKEQYAIGVTVIEVRKNEGQWEVVRDSAYNKRWHVNSPMQISGPARGSSLLTTPLSTDGAVTYGTINNCGHGVTPWGTYLTGEENFFAYFTLDDASSDSTALGRYGIVSGTRLFNYKDWDKAEGAENLQRRFNASRKGGTASHDFRNEPNRFGYVVEIDPYRADAVPKKRSAIGRFSHEGAWFAPAVSGKPLVCYSGDDARNEYIYKFESAQNWDPADASGGIETGDKYLDKGTLYVARFNDDGTGNWLPLTPDNPDLKGMAADEIAIHTRLAADRAGATAMDRPEWGGVNPLNSEVYFSLTNNTSSRNGRGQGGTASRPRNAANPRSYSKDGDPTEAGGNINGHVIRWRESDNAESFTWDIYAFGARSTYSKSGVNISGLDDSNDFSSPDGLWFDKRGLLWLQTDDSAYTDVTNCMMLAAIPGSVGDGAAVDVAGADGVVTTYVGAAPGNRMRRFLVGVPGSEITGVDMTPDNRTMFVNIQHPGENGDLTRFASSWPNPNRDALAEAVPGQRPRTATIVITRDDGGEIGV